jgi:hypothetical protein
LIALAAGALVLLVFGIAIGAALWVDGGLPAALGFTHRDSPKVVAGHYLDQLTAGNPGEANTLVCKAERDRNGGTGPIGLRLTGLVKYQVGEEHITEKTARVDVDVTVPVLGQLTIAIRLVDEDGQWRVCGGGLGARASAGAGSATTS